MALIDYRISTVYLECNCTPSPIVPTALALQTIVSKSDPQYILTGVTGNVYSSEVGLPYIPGASLPVGSKWLIYYQLSAGSSTSTGMVFASLVVGAHAISNPAPYSVAAGWFETTDHGTPEFMRGAHMAGLFPYTGEGRILEFWLQSTQGGSIPVYFGGIEIVAIRMDTLGAVMEFGSINKDYNATFDPLAPDVISTSTTYQAIANCFYTNSSAEDFLISASCDVNMALNEHAKCRLTIDGVQQKGEWIKQAADNRDVHSFTWLGKVPLVPGAHTITIEGAKYDGVAQAKFMRPKITILKLSSFGGHVFTSAPVPTINATYPAWDPCLSLDYTSPTTGEYALVMGQGMVSRNNVSAASMCRILNTITGQPLTEFTTIAHPTVDGFERTTLISGGCELVGGGSNTYKWQLTAEPGFVNAPHGSLSWEPCMVVLGLSKAGAAPPPTTVVLTGTESIAPVDSPTIFSQPAGPLIGTDLITGFGDTAVLSAQLPINIPLVHPRLWIYNNDRLAYWQTLPEPYWTNFVNMKASSRAAWHEAMAYLATGTQSYLDAALSKVDAILASTSRNDIIGSDGAGLYYLDLVESMALCYDWLYTHLDDGSTTRRAKMKDYLLAGVYMIFWNNAAVTTWGSTFDTNNWSVSNSAGTSGPNPLQNYFSRQILGALYASVALYGEQPVSFSYPPGATSGPGSNVQFQIPYRFTIPYVYYTDLWAWFEDMVAATVPYWVESAEGGGWLEGANYGRAAIRHQIQMFGMMKDVAGFNYIDTLQYLRDAATYVIHNSQNGRQVLVPFGDPGNARNLPFSDYDRHLLLLATDALSGGSLEATNAQYVTQNETDLMDHNPLNASQMIPWDFFLARDSLPQTDYKTNQNLWYFADGTGFVCSRQGWGDNDVCVVFSSQDFLQDHQHEDQNSIFIFKGSGGPTGKDGWLLTDPLVHSGSGSGDYEDAQWHNTYTVGGLGQRYSSGPATSRPCGRINRRSGSALFTYAQGDCNDAYWTPKSSHVGTPVSQMNDIFLREFVHIRTLGIVILHDRFRLLPAYSGSSVIARFHYPLTQPIVDGANTIRLDRADSRIWRRLVEIPGASTPGLSVVSNGTSAAPSFREEIPLTMGSTGGKLVTIFQIATTTTGSMGPTNHTPITGLGLVPGTYEGVTIEDASGWVHVLFSSNQDGSTPVQKDYYVFRNLTTDKHIVCNLIPGQEYHVVETSLGSGYYRYTITNTFLTGFVANNAGVLEFRPVDLVNQDALLLTATDTIAAANVAESQTTTLAKTIQASADEIGTTESGLLIITGGTPVTLVGAEAITPSDSYGLGFNLHGTELLGVVDYGSLTAELTYAAMVTYTEKTITSGGPDLIPIADLGASFAIPEPNDGVFFSKLADSNDGTFVHTPFPLPAFIVFNDVAVALGNGYVYQGTIRAVRFKGRIVASNVVGAANPVVAFRLFNKSTGVILAQASVPLSTTNEITEVESSLITVQIPAAEVPELGIGYKLGAVTYGPNMVLDVSRVWVENVSDSTEKVIA